MSYAPRLKKKYVEEITPRLKEQFGYKTIMQVPRLEKISLNQGLGRAILEKKVIEDSIEELSLIAGQRAVPTKAKKSISNFKLREGMAIGARVTLRGNIMYEFLDRLICVALPRVRDFRGISEASFDGRGNFSIGITEQIIFPEIDIDDIPKINGLDITLVTSAKTDKEALELLSEMGMPFKNKNK